MRIEKLLKLASIFEKSAQVPQGIKHYDMPGRESAPSRSVKDRTPSPMAASRQFVTPEIKQLLNQTLANVTALQNQIKPNLKKLIESAFMDASREASEPINLENLKTATMHAYNELLRVIKNKEDSRVATAQKLAWAVINVIKTVK